MVGPKWCHQMSYFKAKNTISADALLQTQLGKLTDPWLDLRGHTSKGRGRKGTGENGRGSEEREGKGRREAEA